MTELLNARDANELSDYVNDYLVSESEDSAYKTIAQGLLNDPDTTQALKTKVMTVVNGTDEDAVPLDSKS